MSSSDKIEPFVLAQDSLVTYTEWKAWRQAFSYYIVAKDITDPKRQLAMLMHRGGCQLQEIYATIEAADPKAAKDAKDPLEFALTALEDHFKPITNKIYERHVFRQIRQGTDSLEQFVVRLKRQAANCAFHDAKEMVVDQIVEGTSDPTFRREIFRQKLTKLQAVIDLGKLLESVSVQSSSMDGSSATSQDAVARLRDRDNRSATSQNRTSNWNANQSFSRRCSRCNASSHVGSDESCPAKSATCFRCQQIGHYASKCRSRSRMPAPVNSSANPSKSVPAAVTPPKVDEAKPAVRAVGKEYSSSSDEDGNLFVVSSADPALREKCDNRVSLRFGDVHVRPIIDSGADRNLLAPALWRKLKKAKVDFVVVPVQSRIFPYGRKEPLPVECAVEFWVTSRRESVKAQFLVMKEDGGEYETIVGRVLGVKLGILRISEDVDEVKAIRVDPVMVKRTGKLIDEQLRVPLDPSVTPVAQPCRKTPFALRRPIRSHMSELLDDDIVEEVINEPTTWQSPIVPVIKKSGDLRLCIDMRQANKAVLREKYPIPTFEELLAEMTDCSIFSKIDLRSAYNQIELHPDSRAITTFVTLDGVYRFKRLYCGIKCAPEMFQRIMSKVIAGLENVRVFFDDIIIFSKNRLDHDRHVSALLQRLKEKGLTINEKKCVFAVPEVEFLGHRVSKNQIRPNETNEEAVKAFKPPRNKKDLQSFLGLMNFVSKFIPDFSSVTAPLRELLGKNIPFRWNVRHSKVFDALKQAVIDVKLAIFDPKAKILIVADASPVGLGAVLLQRKNESSEPEILAFASRSLSKPEMNYSQIEREALGLVWACERFRLYTIGKTFDLYTDHKPLEFLFGPKSKPNARIERWLLRLQNFDYNVHYIQGHTNIADPLSRLSCETPSRHSYLPSLRVAVRAVAAKAVPTAISMNEFRAASEADPEIVQIVSALRKGSKLPDAFMKVRYELTFVDSLVLRGDRLVPPQSLRARILAQAHEGHPGIAVMKRRLRTKVWWPRIDVEAEQYVRDCRSCLVVSQLDPPEPMHRSALPQSPWEYVAIDHMGPLRNGQYLLVAVDYFSRFIEFQFTSSTASKETIGCLYQMFARFGFPSRIKTDNATVFKSTEFEDFLVEYGIEHVTSPPLWPRANGEVERQNRSLLKRLKIAIVERKSLQVELAKYVVLYHTTPHPSTGVSPAELMLQRRIRDKLPSLAHPSPFYDDIKDKDAEVKAQGKLFAERGRGAVTPPKKLQVGDLVLLSAKKTDKLSPSYDPQPYEVVESAPNEVLVRRGTQLLRRSTSMVKPLPASANREQERVEAESMQSGGVLETEQPESPPGSPFRGFPESPGRSPARPPGVTRFGRVVRPPDRLDV